MRKNGLIAGVSVFAALWACSVLAADEPAYTKACAAAEEARKMAAELRYQWNTIEPLMKKASEAAAVGDYAKGVKLCDEARKQSEVSIAQARQQADAWRAAVVK